MSEELTTAELLAAVLGVRRTTMSVQRMLTAVGALPRWTRQALGPHGLAARYAIPYRWAVAVCAVDELAERHSSELPGLRSARDALILLSDLHRSRVETAAVLLLDGGWRRMGIGIVGIGSVDRVDVAPADVFGPALRAGASAVIVAHSHVYPDPTPTAADRRLAERLRRAADLLGVPLLDHLVVAQGSAYSFAEAERWPSLQHGYRGSVTARTGGYHGRDGCTPRRPGTRERTQEHPCTPLPSGPPGLVDPTIAQMFGLMVAPARREEERAAVLALVDASPRDWHRTATLILEAGGARRLLDPAAWTGLETFDIALAEELASRVPDGALDEKEVELRRLAEAGITVVTVLDEGYPVNLRFIYNLPPALYIRGALQPEDSRAIAVVGTRQASDEGLERAAHLATELARHGVTVVSGLARGIDTAAHEAALAAGGRTIAVLGTGIESPIYPAENRELAERILERGALVSQFRPTAPPTKFSFPMRNVVMSGMSTGTVVVEASATSGAKMQARLALDHGKPVFLLDSLVTKQAWAQDYAERRGARVVRTVDDIVAALTAMQTPAQQLSLV